MSHLIKDLKIEHVQLLQIFNDVKSIGVQSIEGKEKLISAKDIFLSHLKKEDESLYPVLRKRALTDQHLMSLLDTFATDMDQITKRTLDFFEKYKGEGFSAGFESDFSMLYGEISGRIRKEESILYEEFEKNINKD